MPTTTPDLWTPARITALRARLKISRDELAETLGLSLSATYHFENGTRTPAGSTVRLLGLLDAGKIKPTRAEE